MQDSQKEANFKNNFSPSSFERVQALQCNFPPVDFVFHGGRHEVSAFMKIMALRRFKTPDENYKTADGHPNTAYICKVCHSKMVIRFASKATGSTKGVVKQQSKICSCSLRSHPKTRKELVETSYASVWDLQCGVVGYLFGTARIPVVCMSSSSPLVLHEQARGKGFWLKNLAGRWLFIAYRVVVEKKIRSYALRGEQFPQDHDVENTFVGLPDSRGKNVIMTENARPKEPIKTALIEVHSECSCCHTDAGIFRFVCECDDKVTGNSFCKDCLHTKVTTRRRLKEIRENDPILLYYDENDRSSCTLCNYGHKVTNFYPVGEDSNSHSIRCPFPVAWLYNRPFFEHKEIELYKPIFEQRIQPLVDEMKKIKFAISCLQSRKNAYREQMTKEVTGWSEDQVSEEYDRELDSLNRQLQQIKIPQWAEHPSCISNPDDHKLPPIERSPKRARIDEEQEEVIDLC